MINVDNGVQLFFHALLNYPWQICSCLRAHTLFQYFQVFKVWYLGHNCRSSDSRKIERIQDRALRAVFNSHSESYENLLVRAELPSLLNRRLQDIAILMYKVKYGLAPSTVEELFKQKSTSYSLRNSDFYISTFNTINCYIAGFFPLQRAHSLASSRSHDI